MSHAILDEMTSAACQPTVTPGVPRRAPSQSKIMIVDDASVNIKTVRKYLALAGYSDFVVTTDPTQVLTMLEQEDPDLLLLDIMMPQISGLEILQSLRSQQRFQWLPVL